MAFETKTRSLPVVIFKLWLAVQISHRITLPAQVLKANNPHEIKLRGGGLGNREANKKPPDPRTDTSKLPDWAQAEGLSVLDYNNIKLEERMERQRELDAMPEGLRELEYAQSPRKGMESPPMSPIAKATLLQH